MEGASRSQSGIATSPFLLMVAATVRVEERSIAAVGRVIVHPAVKDSEKSSVRFSTTRTTTIFKDYLKT